MNSDRQHMAVEMGIIRSQIRCRMLWRCNASHRGTEDVSLLPLWDRQTLRSFLLHRISSYIHSMNNLKLVILFGSQATGSAGKTSDTDIAVLGERPLTLDEKSKLEEQYAQRFSVPEERVDLIDLSVAPPILKYQVAQSGRLLHGMEEDFIRFKVLAWKQYLNTERFRRYRQQSLESKFNVEGRSS